MEPFEWLGKYVDNPHFKIYTIGIFLVGFMMGGVFHMNVLPSQPDSSIDKDNYEQVMVREAIDSYNNSLTHFESNRTSTGIELVRSANTIVWGLMWSHDRKLYEPVFKSSLLNCVAKNSSYACSQSVNDSIKYLEKVEEREGWVNSTAS